MFSVRYAFVVSDLRRLLHQWAEVPKTGIDFPENYLKEFGFADRATAMDYGHKDENNDANFGRLADMYVKYYELAPRGGAKDVPRSYLCYGYRV